MLNRVVLAALGLTAVLATPGFAAEPEQGREAAPPEAKQTMQVGNPHERKLSPAEEEAFDRRLEQQQQEEVAEWSGIMGGPAEPTPGMGVGPAHGTDSEPARDGETR